MKKIKTRVQCLRYNRRLAQVLRRECEKYGRNPRMPRDSYGNSGFRVQTMHNWTRYAEDNDISFLDPGSVGERVLWKNFSSMHSHVGYVATPSIFSTEGRARVGMQVSGFERFVPQTKLDRGGWLFFLAHPRSSKHVLTLPREHHCWEICRLL